MMKSHGIYAVTGIILAGILIFCSSGIYIGVVNTISSSGPTPTSTLSPEPATFFNGQYATGEESQSVRVSKTPQYELNGSDSTQPGALRTVTEESQQSTTNESGTQFSSLKHTLEYVRYSSNLPVSRWDLNSTNNEVTLFVYDVHNETMMTDYQGKRIGNYTFNFIRDTAFEENRKETIDYLTQLQEDPDYEIVQIVTMTDAFGDPPANYIELWVYNSTPKNKELNFKKIKGWILMVYPLTKSIQMQEQMEKMAAANRSVPEVPLNAR